MTTTRFFRVGLLGAGYISGFHIQALRRLPNVQIVGIADLDLERAKAVAKEFGLPEAFASMDELVAAGIDVVHVLTPPATHAKLTLEALRHGCDVFVEKPATTSVEDCKRITQAERETGRRVGVNHSNLRDPIYVQALNRVNRGEIGEVINVTYLRSSVYPPYLGGTLPPQYRDGGYPFRDMGVHGLYMLEAFLGDVLEVSGQFATKGGDPNLMHDEWAATVRCKKGLGQMRLSWNAQPLENQLIVEGTRGTLRADLFSMFVTVRKKTRVPSSIERIINALRESCQIAWQVPLNVLRYFTGRIRRYHGLQDMVREFYESLAEERPVPVSVQAAQPIVDWTERVARVADAAKSQLLDQLPKQLTADVLVTGGSGFIGRHLVSALIHDGHRVRVLMRRFPDAETLSDSRIEVVVGDLGDPQVVSRAVKGTKVVYHLGAAMTGPAHDFERGTVAGTRNIVESVLEHGVEKLVYVSSLSVLHASAAKWNAAIKEDWPLEPNAEMRGHYTSSKLAAEQIVSDAVKERGLKAVILRPGQVFGPGAPLLTPAVARKVGKRLLIIGDGQLTLPLVHVDDVVDALLQATNRNVFDGSIFHIVDLPYITQNSLAHRIRKANMPNAKIVHVPRWFMNLAATGVELLCRFLKRRPPLSIYRLDSALAPMKFDCTAARKQLGWTPAVGVMAGLEEMLRGEQPEPAATTEPARKPAHIEPETELHENIEVGAAI